MGMTRSVALEKMIGKHREALARSTNFRCACCERILPREAASHVDAYQAYDPILKQVVPEENIATYVLCQECARLPEEKVRLRVEKYLVNHGLLRKDLKPLDQPGGHSPEHLKHRPGQGHALPQGVKRLKPEDNQLFPGQG